MSREAEALCQAVYEQTRAFYAQKTGQLKDAACGFRILYGPPTVAAPMLFLGYQPGGSLSHGEPSEHEGWPRRSDYAIRDWPLARRMREIWSVSVLEECTGLNLIFFRSPRIHTWKRVPDRLREELEQFSYSRVKQIVEALAPRKVVVIGLGTFNRLVEGPVALENGNRVLIRKGELWGVLALGVIHLSGARLSGTDVTVLRDYFSRPENSN
jgi:hypothetical protein